MIVGVVVAVFDICKNYSDAFCTFLSAIFGFKTLSMGSWEKDSDSAASALETRWIRAFN
jgi:hypothetical protein